VNGELVIKNAKMLDEERQESVLIIIFLSLVPEEVAHLPQPLPSGYE
jgi:hypothetical protein